MHIQRTFLAYAHANARCFALKLLIISTFCLSHEKLSNQAASMAAGTTSTTTATAEDGRSEYTEDGTVDLKGNRVLRSKSGGWTACSFIVGSCLSLLILSISFLDKMDYTDTIKKNRSLVVVLYIRSTFFYRTAYQ